MYNQKDTRWKNRKINGTSSTMGNYGCFITSLSELAHITPLEALGKLEGTNAMSKDLIVSGNASKLLGLQYDGITTKHPTFRCIAEVDFNSATAAKEQHFVVWNPDGSIDDPWGGVQRKKGHYKIINYRLFHEKPVDTTNPNYKYCYETKSYNIKSELHHEIEKLTGEFDDKDPDDHEKTAKLLKARIEEIERKNESSLEDLKSQLAFIENSLTAKENKIVEDVAVINRLTKENENLKESMEDMENTVIGKKVFEFGKYIILKK